MPRIAADGGKRDALMAGPMEAACPAKIIKMIPNQTKIADIGDSP